MTDLNSLSLKDLKKLRTTVEREIAKRSEQSKRSLHKKIRELAAAEGMDINDISGLLGSDTVEPAPKRKKRAPSAPVSGAKPAVEPKYFNQIDPGKTWSGRGRKPEWVVTWLENGGDLEKLTKRPF